MALPLKQQIIQNERNLKEAQRELDRLVKRSGVLMKFIRDVKKLIIIQKKKFQSQK